MTNLRCPLSAFLVFSLAFVVFAGCSPSPKIPFAALIAEVKAKNVSQVTFSKDSAAVKFKVTPKALNSGGLSCTVAIATEKEAGLLMAALQAENVPFEIEAE